ELDTLPQSKIWLRPSSVGHLVNVLFSFLFWFTASVFSFSVYIVSKNIMILALSLLVLFGGFLMVNRKVVKEGKLAVKYRIDEGINRDVCIFTRSNMFYYYGCFYLQSLNANQVFILTKKMLMALYTEEVEIGCEANFDSVL